MLEESYEPDLQLQNEADPAEECGASYEEVLKRMEELLDAHPNQIASFIEHRLHNLEAKADPSLELSHVGHNQHEGFIHPKAEVVRNLIVDRLHIDDPEVFRIFFETVQTFKKTPSWQEKTIREMLLPVLQWTIGNYFGNHTGTTESEGRNRALYMGAVTADSNGISIRELRGQNCGVCCEKAAIAQNLLAFVGADSRIIFSDDCEFPEGNKGGDAHVYILLRTSTGKYLYDPANPSAVIKAEDNSLITCGPEIHKLTDEQYNGVIGGKDVTVTHRDVLRSSDGRDEAKSQRVKYSGSKAFG